MSLPGAFTRFELALGVVAIAVWVTLALPGYLDYVTRSKFMEAHIVLDGLETGMERQLEETSSYVGGPCAPTGPNEPVSYFDFSCAPGEPTTETFTLLAVGRSGTDVEGLTFSVNHAAVRATMIASGSHLSDHGYRADPTCWVVRRSDLCTD